MALITALLHTENDGLRLGRALETVYACDEIVVVDHGSRDGTVRVAREYGARVVDARPKASPEEYISFAKTGSAKPKVASSGFVYSAWIFCLDPRESLTEKLAASLFEWKSESRQGQASTANAFSVFLREETAEGWVEVPTAQTRLVPQGWNSWKGRFPADAAAAVPLEGELLRFVFP
jgi:glycosyltransferase involved in cell wall biosynthesis